MNSVRSLFGIKKTGEAVASSQTILGESGPGGPAPAAPAAPAIAAMLPVPSVSEDLGAASRPSVMLPDTLGAAPATPALSSTSTMPSTTSTGVLNAGRRAQRAIASRAGRNATVLTDPTVRPKPRRDGGATLASPTSPYAQRTFG